MNARSARKLPTPITTMTAEGTLMLREPASNHRLRFAIVMMATSTLTLPVSSAQAQTLEGEQALGRLALAIAAYDATAKTCFYEPVVGEVLGELDAFVGELRADWDAIKREGRDVVPQVRNMAQLMGVKSDCVALANAVGLALPSALMIGKFDPPLMLEMGRLTQAGGGRSIAGSKSVGWPVPVPSNV